MTRYYDFRFGRDNAGYYEVTDNGSEMAFNAVFEIDGEVYENPFRIRYSRDIVVSYSYADGEWVDCTEFPDDHYPMSAYPLVLTRMKDRFVYQAINEGTGAVVGSTVMKRVGDTVEEWRDGVLLRSFTLSGDEVIRIEWGGGANSSLKSTFEDAVAGSPFALRDEGARLTDEERAAADAV